MKTIEQVKEDLQKEGFESDDIVYTTEDFLKAVERGFFTSYDGIGYYHDGENETDISVFSYEISFAEAVKKYPYVCWYNK